MSSEENGPPMPPMGDMPNAPFSDMVLGWMGLNEMVKQMMEGGFTEKQACYMATCILMGSQER